MKDFTLFMFPFGGGNETSYQKFEQYLDKKINIVNGEAPGKGRRIKEPLLKNIYLIADEYFEQFKSKVKEPYAVYGHSMGAYLGHLFIQRIMDEGLPLPKHFFVTSKIAPSKNYNKKRSIYTNEQFIKHLKDLKGMPDAILENDELLSIFLPIIRNDFDALDNYKYRAHKPYPVDMTVICGTKEDVAEELVSSWSLETSARFTLETWEGHHFWIFDHLPDLCQRINSTLSEY